MSVHFEVFRRQGKSGWSLVEAMPNRDLAVAKAKEVLQAGAAAAKVVKETLQRDGEYMALTIFEETKDGGKPKKEKRRADILAPLPCFKPDDLYSYHARMTMQRILAEWLARQKLSVTELIHSAPNLEKFEATGTTYQHAIQKVAVAEVSGTTVPVSQIVKTLNDLTTKAIHRVYKDERRNYFPVLGIGEFGPLVHRLGTNPDARYIVNGGLTKYLASATSWDEKLKRLLALMPEIAADGPERVLLLGAVDGLVAEMLTGAAALADLLGHNDNLGQALYHLTDLFLGNSPNESASEGLNELAQYFRKDYLPEARIAIANRIVSELKSMKRLCPASLEDELRMLRRLANHLVLGQGKYLSNEELITAFTERSKRLVTHELLGQFLSTAKSPDERLEKLLLVEENIVGAENKRILFSFIVPIVTHNGFDDAVCGADAPPLTRMKRIADLQTRVLRASFQEMQKSQIANLLDLSAARIEDRARVVASFEARILNPVERARALLKLCTSGTVTEVVLSQKVKRALMSIVSKPGFANAYIAKAREIQSDITPESAITDLLAQLARAGIGSEESVRVPAA